ARRAGMTAGGSRNDVGVVRSVQRVSAIVPVIAAERAARQRVLDDVEELTVAAVHLQLAVVQHVIRAADSRSNLASKAKVDRDWIVRAIRRQVFLVEANACIDGE